MLGLFVSGIKKQTGKTLVSCGLCATMQSLSYPTSYYKPIQTGAQKSGTKLLPNDVLNVQKFDSTINASSAYLMEGEECPIVSSYESGIKKIEIQGIYNEFVSNIQMTDCHIVEGSNSISSPINEGITEVDVAKSLPIPLLMIVNPKKSTIDEVISGLNYVYSARKDIIGVIINEYDPSSNSMEERYFPQLITRYTGAKVIGTFPHYKNFETLTPGTLIEDVLNNVNLESLFGIKIAKLEQN
jgi:dethiobiotin synthetase